MNTTTLKCSHPRLRALDYNEDTFHWDVACHACGWTGTMTQAEWRVHQKRRGTPGSNPTLRVFDDRSGPVVIR